MHMSLRPLPIESTPISPVVSGRVQMMRPVQRQDNGESYSNASIREHAQRGFSDLAGTLPHAAKIQKSFGHHDISHVRAHTGRAAADANAELKSEAYASGTNIAFASNLPSLRTTAHETAHIIQQASGISLPDGVGQKGDIHERHADEVADRVVRGQSAEALLDRYARPSSPHKTPQPNVQRMQVQFPTGRPGNAAQGTGGSGGTNRPLRFDFFGSQVTVKGDDVEATGRAVTLPKVSTSLEGSCPIPIAAGASITLRSRGKFKLQEETGATWNATKEGSTVSWSISDKVQGEMALQGAVTADAGLWVASAGAGLQASLESNPEIEFKISGKAKKDASGEWVAEDVVAETKAVKDQPVKVKGQLVFVTKFSGLGSKRARVTLGSKTVGKWNLPKKRITLISGTTVTSAVDAAQQLFLRAEEVKGQVNPEENFAETTLEGLTDDEVRAHFSDKSKIDISRLDEKSASRVLSLGLVGAGKPVVV